MNAKTARVLARAAVGVTACNAMARPTGSSIAATCKPCCWNSTRASRYCDWNSAPGSRTSRLTAVASPSPPTPRAHRATRRPPPDPADGLWSSCAGASATERPAVRTPHGLARPCSPPTPGPPDSGHPRFELWLTNNLTSCTIPCEAAPSLISLPSSATSGASPAGAPLGSARKSSPDIPREGGQRKRARFWPPPSNGPSGRCTTARRSRAGAETR